MKTLMKWIMPGVMALGFLSTSCLAAPSTNTESFSDKNVNVNWNVPVSLLGYFSASVNLRISHKMTIGVLAGFLGWSFSNDAGDSVSAGSVWSVGGQLHYAMGDKDIMSDGVWMLNPFVEYMGVKSGDGTSGIGGGILFMYQWAWPFGMSMQLGFGPAYYHYSSFSGKGNAGQFGPALAYNIGYNF